MKCKLYVTTFATSQEPSSTTHNSALDLTPSAKSGTSTTDTAATVSRKASSAVPLKLLQIHNTEPEADGNGTDTISAASASKAHNSNSKPAIDVAEASAPVTAAPLTEVQNGHSKPANNTVGTSDTASSSASLTATQNGGMKQKNDTGSQPKQAHPKQQAAAPATGSAAILAKIR